MLVPPLLSEAFPFLGVTVPICINDEAVEVEWSHGFQTFSVLSTFL